MATEKQILGKKALTERLSKLETNEEATPLLFSATVGFFSVACGGFFFMPVYWLEGLTGANCQRTVRFNTT